MLHMSCRMQTHTIFHSNACYYVSIATNVLNDVLHSLAGIATRMNLNITSTYIASQTMIYNYIIIIYINYKQLGSFQGWYDQQIFYPCLPHDTLSCIFCIKPPWMALRMCVNQLHSYTRLIQNKRNVQVQKGI